MKLKQTIYPAQLPVPHLSFSRGEISVLRRLAAEVATLAARPVDDEKRALWRKHNALEHTRPLIFCDPENSWHEIIPPGQLSCEGETARQWEWLLRRSHFWGQQMGDDRPTEPYFDIPYVRSEVDWGLKERRFGGERGGAYRWDSPIKTEADLGKLCPPQIKVDFRATEQLAEVAKRTFGDLLTVRIATPWWWSLGMTRTLAELRGLQQLMIDMIEHPELVHWLMTFLRDGTLKIIENLEEANLLSPNWDGTYVGSGGLGWSDELPQSDFTGQVRLGDMWGFAESQETVGISPQMFAEFIFPYQRSLLARFGLNCYGCCEPVDKRWFTIKQIPNLRRVSISPWSDRTFMAERLQDKYIFSMKPNPTDLAMPSLDEERIRAQLRQDLQITRNCRVEIIMKDNHTLRNDPGRVLRWVQIAREEVERL